MQISIHALLAESDAKKTSIAGRITSFLSTLSLRRATVVSVQVGGNVRHFYPRSPCGERLVNSTGTTGKSNISIHALLAESDAPNRRPCPRSKISIHALLAESDSLASGINPDQSGISIHALLAESDKPALYQLYDTYAFLSTLSLRRATLRKVPLLGIK